MRHGSTYVAVVGALVTASCLSETLMNNYRDGGAETGNSAGAPAIDQPPVLIGIPPVTGNQSMSGFVSSPSSAEAGHSGSGYLSTGFWQAGAVTPIHFGVTSRDHVVVLSEVGIDDTNASWLRLSELTATGAVLRNLDLRLGAMPEVFRLLPDGSMVFAGKLSRDVSFGKTRLGKLEQGFYIVKLDAEWNEVFAFAKSASQSLTLQDIAIKRDGSIYLASDEAGIVEFDSSGNVLLELKGVAGARLAIDESQNSLLVAGTFRGNLVLGATSLVSQGARDGVVFCWDESSQAISSIWQFGGVDDDEATGIAIADSGARVIGGRVGRQESLFGATLRSSARGAAFVAEVDASGHAHWARQLAEEGRVSDVARARGAIYVAAYTKSDSAVSSLESSSDSSGMRLQVTRFSEAGEQTAFFAFDGQLDRVGGHGRLGLDSTGVLWLSAFGQIRMEGWSDPQMVTAIYRMVPVD